MESRPIFILPRAVRMGLKILQRRRVPRFTITGDGLPGDPINLAISGSIKSYSITSSQSSKNESDRPSALAVFRLTTSSNLIGDCTGKFPGRSPLRMRSTYALARRLMSPVSVIRLPAFWHLDAARGPSTHHSITSSARAMTDAGISRPIAFAVFRLITNSNVTGCAMGRFSGLLPRRILSV
jgi:hypothetical protein